MAAPTAVGPAGEMVAWAVPPVAVLSTVAAVSVTNPYPHVYVADFGERRSGVVRLKGVTGCAAGEIHVRSTLPIPLRVPATPAAAKAIRASPPAHEVAC